MHKYKLLRSWWLIVGGLGWATRNRAFVLPTTTTYQGNSSPERLGGFGPYSKVFWPGSLSPDEDLDNFFEIYTLGSAGSLSTAGFVRLVSTQGNGVLITVPVADSAYFNYSLSATMPALSAGFSGAACLNYTIETSSASVQITLQDQQNLITSLPDITPSNSSSLTALDICRSAPAAGRCQASGVLGLDDTYGTYAFFMNTSAAASSWVAMNYTLLPMSDPVCQDKTAMQQVGPVSRLNITTLSISKLGRPTSVYTGRFYNQIASSPLDMSAFVGAFWNLECFSASLLTFAPNALPAVNLELSVYDFSNFQNYLAGFRTVAIGTCLAGARNSNPTCQITKTLNTPIFVVASYNPLVNGSLVPQLDYVYEVLTAAYATDAECQAAPQGEPLQSASAVSPAESAGGQEAPQAPSISAEPPAEPPAAPGPQDPAPAPPQATVG